MNDLWQTISRYPRYLITITLGIFFFIFEKFKPFLKRPVTAVAMIGLLVGVFTFVTLTLKAMLGLSAV